MQIDLAVLAGLSAAPAVAGCLVGLEVDLSAEGMGELLGTAAALLAQEVLLPEVLTQISIVADRVSAGALSALPPQPVAFAQLALGVLGTTPCRPTHTCSSLGPHLSHRSGRSSGLDAGALAAHHYPGSAHRRTCRVGVHGAMCHQGPPACGAAPGPCASTTCAHT